MGLGIEHIISDFRYYNEFTCGICHILVDLDAVVTTISCCHCICKRCLEQQMKGGMTINPTSPSKKNGTSATLRPGYCPTCDLRLIADETKKKKKYHDDDDDDNYDDDDDDDDDSNSDEKTMRFQRGNTSNSTMRLKVQPLETWQPLAYRILKKMHIRCPLRACGVNCLWKGDYSTLEEHLLSTTYDDHLVTSIIPSPKSSDTDISSTLDNNNESNKSTGAGTDENKHQTGSNGKKNKKGQKKANNGNDSTKANNGSHNIITVDHVKVKILAAKSFKDEANIKFSAGLYDLSRDFYSRGIAVLLYETADFVAFTTEIQKEAKNTLSILFSNRAAAHLELKDYSAAESDCTKAIHYDREFLKAYVRRSKALIQLGEFDKAVTVLQISIQQIPKSRTFLTKEFNAAKDLSQLLKTGTERLEKKDYRAAKVSFDQILVTASPVNVLINAAWADLGLGLTDSVNRITRLIIKDHGDATNSFETSLLRGKCHVLIGNTEEIQMGIQLIRQAMKLDPDSSTGRKILLESIKLQNLHKQAKEYLSKQQYLAAARTLTLLIDPKTGEEVMIIPIKSPLFYKLLMDRASAYYESSDYDNALKDYNRLMQDCRDDDVNIWIMKFDTLHALERHKEVINEIERLQRTKGWARGNALLKKALAKARLEIKKQNRPDFYKLLQIPPAATEKEIRKAYRVRALQLHPDRLVGSNFTDEQRKQAQSDFHLLADALEVLTDSYKRRLYDDGHDLQYIKEAAAEAADARNSWYTADPFSRFF